MSCPRIDGPASRQRSGLSLLVFLLDREGVPLSVVVRGVPHRAPESTASSLAVMLPGHLRLALVLHAFIIGCGALTARQLQQPQTRGASVIAARRRSAPVK